MAVRVAVLGPLEVADGAGRPIVVGGRGRRVLVALAMSSGLPVSLEVLVDAVWPVQPPATARKAVLNALSCVRQLLGEAAVERVGGAYRLVVATDVDDANHVLSALRRGERLGPDALRRVLDLWRGEPLCDLAGWVPGEAETRRWISARENLEDAWAEAALAECSPVGLSEVLEAMAIRSPLRERRWALLMRALSIDGRRADALRVYQRARRLLGDELGLPPGPELAAAERSILQVGTPLVTDEGPDFVGRSAEVATLSGLWKGARRGRFGVATIVGEAGIGKSRLVHRLIDSIDPSYHRLIVGQPTEFVAELARVVARNPGMRGGYPSTLDQVLGFRVGPLPSPDEVARAVGSLFAELASGNGLVVVVEDLHDATEDLLDVVVNLVQHQRPPHTLLVLTARAPSSAWQVSDGLERLATLAGRHRWFTEIGLEALSLEDIDSVVGGDGAAIYERSGGNPLFALALSRWNRTDRLPPSLTALVGERLSALPPPARRWIELASIVGHDIEAAVVARAVDESDAELLAALDVLVTERFIRSQGNGRFRFAHPLLLEGTKAALGAGEQAQLHHRVLDALDALGVGDVETRAGHAVAASSIDPTLRPDAARLAAAAAASAATRGAHQSAVTWYNEALLLHPTNDAYHCELLIGLGQTLAVSADTSFRSPLTEAADTARQLGDDQREASALLSANRVFSANTGSEDSGLVDRLTRLRHRLHATGDIDLAARVAAAEAAERFYTVNVLARQDAVAAATRLLARCTDPATIAYVEVRLLAITWDNCTSLERRYTLERLLDPITAHGDLIEQAVVRSSLVATLTELADHDEAARQHVALLALAAGIPNPYLDMIVRGPETLLATLRGDTAGALARAQAIKATQPSNVITGVAIEIEIARVQGRWNDMRELALMPGFIGPHRVLHEALAAACLGDPVPARRLLTARHPHTLAATPPSMFRVPEWFMHARLAIVAGTGKQAAAFYRLLQPLSGRIELVAQPLAIAPVDLTLGLLAARAGKTTDADRHLMAALAASRRVDNIAWQAHCLVALAGLRADPKLQARGRKAANMAGIVDIEPTERAIRS